MATHGRCGNKARCMHAVCTGRNKVAGQHCDRPLSSRVCCMSSRRALVPCRKSVAIPDLSGMRKMPGQYIVTSIAWFARSIVVADKRSSLHPSSLPIFRLCHCAIATTIVLATRTQHTSYTYIHRQLLLTYELYSPACSSLPILPSSSLYYNWTHCTAYKYNHAVSSTREPSLRDPH